MVADCAAALHTPIPALMEMEWSEVILWHAEARRIMGAGNGGG